MSLSDGLSYRDTVYELGHMKYISPKLTYTVGIPSASAARCHL